MVSFTFRNGSLFSTPVNYGGIYSVIMAGYYHRIIDSLTKDDAVLDGGANIGAFTFAVFKKVKKVVAVEANENNFKILTENIKRNNMVNVIPIYAALTDSPGEVKFEGEGEVGHISTQGTNVKTTTIDEIESDLGIRFDALKIDIEGSEPAAIMGGARDALKHISKLTYENDRRQLQKVKEHLTNYSEYDYEKLYNYLKQCGFRLDVEEPDKRRYKLLKENIKKGNITAREIMSNEALHGFWYLRKTISPPFSKSVKESDGLSYSSNNLRIEMVYASK